MSLTAGLHVPLPLSSSFKFQLPISYFSVTHFKVVSLSSMAMTHILKPTISMSPYSHFTHSIHSPSSPFKPHSNSHLFTTIIPSRIYSHQTPPPTALSRRLFLPSVSGIWDAITGGNNAREAILAIRRGMLLFRQGDVLGSVAEFDKAIELDPRQKAYLWQRGLSLYYLDRFEEGAEQFRIDVAQNPNDTEESIWCFLCEAQLYGVIEARKRFLEVGIDPRPVMREAYNLFRIGGDPEKIVAAFSNGQGNEYFYASLYAGLYYESEKKADAAKLHVLAACQSPYGQRSDDYMASLARVHCLCRNWSSNSKVCLMLEVVFFKSLAVLPTNIYLKALLRTLLYQVVICLRMQHQQA